MLISKACAYCQGVLVLAVFVQDGVPAFVCEGCFCLKCIKRVLTTSEYIFFFNLGIVCMLHVSSTGAFKPVLPSACM